MDANIGRGRFRVIDGEPRRPSTAANIVSSTANSDSSSSASAAGHSKHPLSSLTATAAKSRDFVRKVKQTTQNVGKIKHHIKHNINQYEHETNGPQQTEALGIEAFQSSTSSFNAFSSYPSSAVNAVMQSTSPINVSLIHRVTTDTVHSPRNMQTMQVQLDRGGSLISLLTMDSALITDLDNDTLSSTFSSDSFKNDNISSTSSTSSASMKEDDVLVAKHVSTLQETNIQNVNTIKQLLSRMEQNETQLQSQTESMKAELNQWKEKHSLAEKALQRALSHHADAIEAPPLQLYDTKDILYQLQQQNYDLVEKLGRLRSENGQLLAKRQCQEEEESQHVELFVLVEGLQAETDKIHELVSGMSDKLVDLEQVHEDCAHIYETQLASLKDEINQIAVSKEELNTQLLRKLKAQTEEVRKLKMESEEAYQTCDVFQQEIDVMYEALEERRLRAHTSYPRTQHHYLQTLCLGQEEMIIDYEERDSYLDQDSYLDHF
jgi:hypothetical protein